MKSRALQLPATCPVRLRVCIQIAIYLLTPHSSVAFLLIPVNSAQAFGQNRVRVVVAGVHPVGIHCGEILNLKLDEGATEIVGVIQSLGECI